MERSMCKEGQRTILYAYKDYHVDVYARMKRDWNGFITEEERDILVNDLTLVGLFGLFDPLRPNVEASIMFADIGDIQVRMVSGDSIGTAKAIALQSGIISEHEAKHQHCVMHSKEFRKAIGKVITEVDEEGREVNTVENIDNFKTIIKRLRVLARATPEDKYAIVVGLQQVG
jgi:magnesium-transporting ATPase (P-type)